jgi:sec-independent protein translocase protein TatB
MAGDFQKQFNDALKEAELDDVKKSVDGLRGLNPTNEIKKHLNPFEKAASDIRAGLDKAMKPDTAAKPADPAVHAAEPLKNGAATPVVPGPSEMPKAPVFPAMESPSVSPAPTASEPAKTAATAMPGEGGAGAAKARSTPAPKPAAKAANGKTAAAPAKSVAAAKPAASAKAPAAPKPAAASKRVRKAPTGSDN